MTKITKRQLSELIEYLEQRLEDISTDNESNDLDRSLVFASLTEAKKEIEKW